jgi:hypothetical protein
VGPGHLITFKVFGVQQKFVDRDPLAVPHVAGRKDGVVFERADARLVDLDGRVHAATDLNWVA